MKAYERMLSRLEPRSLEGCWIWPGACSSGGYGQVRVDNTLYYVHRLSYEFFVGPIPDGLVIDHLCRNRPCANPSHLEAVTQAQNVIRGTAGNIQRRRTHCPSGHEYTPENVYVPPGRNARHCRRCRQMAAPKWREARRERRARQG